MSSDLTLQCALLRYSHEQGAHIGGRVAGLALLLSLHNQPLLPTWLAHVHILLKPASSSIRPETLGLLFSKRYCSLN